MQQSSNPASLANEATVVDSHHEVLSNTQKQSRGLLEHLQTGLPNPMDLLLTGDITPVKSILDQVSVEPVKKSLIEEEAPKPFDMGGESRLSECLLWWIIEDYYSNKGIDAWQSSVPNFITSSVYIADAYAEMILAFLEGCFDQLDLNEPVYIVEMATGTGRFSHLLLRELERKLKCFSRFQSLQLKYVMTDFTESNTSYWLKHEKLKPFVEKGLLDFAVYNPLFANSCELVHSKQVISGETVKNPVIAIANYFFDSIRQDVFRVESKVLKEGLVTLERNTEGIDPASKPHITQITTKFRYKELYNTNYYAEPRFNEILNQYRHNIRNGTILFPLGALEVIQNLEAMSNKRLVLLSSDKAYTSALEMIRFYQHDFAIHDGAFSYMVNYDAIGQYFSNAGGHVFTTTGKSLSLQTVCCISLDGPDGQTKIDTERLSYIFKEKIDRSNPINSLCATLPGKNEGNEIAQLTYLIGQLRLHMADPQLTASVAQSMVPIVQKGLYSQHDDILMLLETALENYYFYPGECNLPFWASQIYFMLGKYEESIQCLDQTIHYFGAHEALFFLKGQNYEKLEKWAQAREQYEKSVALKSEFTDAWDALAALDARGK
jgi:tetratricopeptide (TPR) repeat protein